jgi:hypothetical protein
MHALIDRAPRSATQTILIACVVGPALFSLHLCRPALAQSADSPTFAVQQRFLEEQIRPLIQSELRSAAVEDRFQYDFGAVLRYTGLWFQDPGPAFPFPIRGVPEFQASRAAHDFDFRPWLAASLDKVHYGFIRAQLDFLQYYEGDAYKRSSDWRGPFVDIGFYRFDVDEACRFYGCTEVENWAADLTIGRQFLYVGRGIAFALTTDAISLDWQCGDWAGLLFGSQSVRHFDNIDRSVPGFSRSDREFFGAQLEYERWDHHRPYIFAVVQRDRSDESPENLQQEYDYDSEYWGIGIRGEALFGEGETGFGIENLQYFGEFIIQTGHSIGDDNNPATISSSRDEIESWALDVGLIYYPQHRTKPRVMLEFARASGDDDRFTPQNTQFGNKPGTDDEGFLGFGFLNTGVSFAPLLANLEFVRLAGALRPFEECCQWRMSDMEVGSSFFLYWRPEDKAGVSDVRADIPGHHLLGSELDLFLNWRLSSDLYVLLNYGVFFPDADSFTVERSRQFVGLTLTWLF